MRSLTVKLTLAFVLTGLSGVALVGIFARYVTVREFDRFLSQQELQDFTASVTDYYRTNGSWTGITQHLQTSAPRGPLPQGGPPREGGPREGGPPSQPGPREGGPPPESSPPFLLADAAGVARTPGGMLRPGQPVPPERLASGTPLLIDGVQVGTIVTLGQPPERGVQARDYLARTNRTLIYATVGGALLALLVGIGLTRMLMLPINALTAAIRAVQGGALHQQVPVQSRDELGELLQAFNQMSADLARSNAARRQMTADIAHELRTPLTVLIGYLESMRDGVLAPSRERFQTMYSEALQLQRLVEDLRLLSLADAGELPLQRGPVAPAQLLEAVASSFEPHAARQSVALRVEAEPALPHPQVDRDRVVQVLGNLVSNALRYTPAGGSITLRAAPAEHGVLLSVADTGSGIAPEALPHIFDRLYRANTARETHDGGSGLGLAIAKAIVEAHGGSIAAQSTLGQGTTVLVRLEA